MYQKKLDLQGDKRDILVTVLLDAADKMDQFQRRIYDDTIADLQHNRYSSKICLTDAQAGIAKYALQQWKKNHEDAQTRMDIEKTVFDQAADMLDQLTMTRKQYADKSAAI